MKRQLIHRTGAGTAHRCVFRHIFRHRPLSDPKGKEGGRRGCALQLSSFTSDDVTKLVLHTPELDYTIDKDDDSKWQVAEGSTLHINTYYIDALCTYGCGVTATKDLGAADENSWRPMVCLIRFPSPTTQTMRTNRSRHSTWENRTPQHQFLYDAG